MLRPLNQGLITVGSATEFQEYVQNTYIPTVLPLMASTTQNRYQGVIRNYLEPTFTEIYNRRSLEDMAGRFISQARRTKKPLTLMMIDVDWFKEVNTRFGHLTGDVVLANTAALLIRFAARTRCFATAAMSS